MRQLGRRRKLGEWWFLRRHSWKVASVAPAASRVGLREEILASTTGGARHRTALGRSWTRSARCRRSLKAFDPDNQRRDISRGAGARGRTGLSARSIGIPRARHPRRRVPAAERARRRVITMRRQRIYARPARAPEGFLRRVRIGRLPRDGRADSRAFVLIVSDAQQTALALRDRRRMVSMLSLERRGRGRLDWKD